MGKVAARITEVREKLTYNQAGVAKIAGVQQKTISNWERGVLPQQWESLIALAESVETTTDYLLGLSDDPCPQKGQELTADLRSIVDICQQLPAARRGDVLAIAEAIAQREAEQRALDMVKAVGGEDALAEIVGILELAEREGSDAARAYIQAKRVRLKDVNKIVNDQ